MMRFLSADQKSVGLRSSKMYLEEKNILKGYTYIYNFGSFKNSSTSEMINVGEILKFSYLKKKIRQFVETMEEICLHAYIFNSLHLYF